MIAAIHITDKATLDVVEKVWRAESQSAPAKPTDVARRLIHLGLLEYTRRAINDLDAAIGAGR